MKIIEILNLPLDNETKATIIESLNKGSDSRPSKKERAVIIFTDKRGVFFGYTADNTTGTVNLRNARNCYYWAAHPDQDGKGFMGLAVKGPYTGSKVSGAATGNTELTGVTCIIDASPEAVKAWEDASWE